MPFMQAPNSRSRQNSNPNGQGTPPAGSQPHPQMPQRVTRDASKSLSEVCPPKHGKRAKAAQEAGLRHRTPRASNRRPPSRTPTRRKRATRVGDMQKDADDPRSPRKRPRTRKGRRQTRMGSSAAFLLRGVPESPANERGGPSRVPPSQVLRSRLPALSPRNAPRGPAAP